MRRSSAGSGSAATDAQRDIFASGAANVLRAGQSITCVSGDHLNGTELCTQVIIRMSGNSAKFGGNAAQRDAANKAIDRLVECLGVHANQANHAGGNTCAQVIAASTT